MSYDLAVWEGERPADDKTAGQVFSRRRFLWLSEWHESLRS